MTDYSNHTYNARTSAKSNNLFIQSVPVALVLLTIVFFAFGVYQLNAFLQTHRLNEAYNDQSILKQPLNVENHLHAYSIGYLHAAKNKPILAAKAFNVAEATENPELLMRTKFAIGNYYFELAQRALNISSDGSHQEAVAHIILAREAYKAAIRIKPDFYYARYNLELLDRLSPEKRTEGWQGGVDGVTLQPFKRNGTAMMKDNVRRGLP